mmetsp:Transcript_69413/g.151596  ORF Transcript_69413/g.151596 Transcript_69413/m.151596 type:complete len:158 (+) Transcript_69413:435-908(+)
MSTVDDPVQLGLGLLAVAIFVGLFACFGKYCMIKSAERTRRREVEAKIAEQITSEEINSVFPIKRLGLPIDIETGIPTDSSVEREDSNLTCSVCLSEIASGDFTRVLHCKHTFHAECLDSWWTSTWKDQLTCPLCRAVQVSVTDLRCKPSAVSEIDA